MKLINVYESPSEDDLKKLKNELGFSGAQMADLAGVSSNAQWRKYTGGASPRSMSQHILFYIAAQLVLDSDALDNVVKKMNEIGAEIK